MPPTKVYLIGESHFDLKKHERYMRAFNRFKPDVITVESREDTITTNLAYLDDNVLRAYPRYQMLRDIFLCGYAAAVDYKRDHPETGLKLIDINREVVNEELAMLQTSNLQEEWRILQWRELLNKPSFLDYILGQAIGTEILEQVIQRKLSVYDGIRAGLMIASQQIQTKVDHASGILDCTYLTIDEREENELGDSENRDKTMVDEIMKQNGVIVHSGGSDHIFGDYENMYERLKANRMDVERVLLLDFNAETHFESQLYKELLARVTLKRLEMMYVMEYPEQR